MNKQIKPEFYAYKGGYDTIVVCKDCGVTALYADMHPVKPCRECGGKLKEGVGMWIEPELDVKFFWFIFPYTVVVKEGYWKLRGETK